MLRVYEIGALGKLWWEDSLLGVYILLLMYTYIEQHC